MNVFDGYLEGIKNKDEKAFAYVYKETKAGVYSVIVSLVKNQSTVEDLMQETYIKMIKNISQYQKGKNFTAWLLQIAKNTALDYLRANKNIVYVDVEEQEHLFKTQDSETANENLDLEDIVSPLDEVEKQIVLLHISGDVKFSDISKVVGKPLGTVLWIYNRAIKKMKSNLERRRYE